jgi:hypothetical protein
MLTNLPGRKSLFRCLVVALQCHASSQKLKQNMEMSGVRPNMFSVDVPCPSSFCAEQLRQSTTKHIMQRHQNAGGAIVQWRVMTVLRFTSCVFLQQCFDSACEAASKLVELHCLDQSLSIFFLSLSEHCQREGCLVHPLPCDSFSLRIPCTKMNFDVHTKNIWMHAKAQMESTDEKKASKSV